MDEIGRPIAGKTYTDQEFDLTGLVVEDVTFIRCVLTLRPGAKTKLIRSSVHDCFLTGAWPEWASDGIETRASWAARTSSGRA